VAAALVDAEAAAAEAGAALEDRRNFEKLLDIQSSMVTVTATKLLLGTSDGISLEQRGAFVSALASTDRRFIMEGDLKKVCRKKNAVCRFWLFSDFLAYGLPSGNKEFTFHRAIDLVSICVLKHSGSMLEHAFEIIGSDKSFVVMAASEDSAQQWIAAIKAAQGARLKATAANQPKQSAAQIAAPAPVWVPDNEGDGCVVCKSVGAAVAFVNECCLSLFRVCSPPPLPLPPPPPLLR
jgi:hypothetical protein